MLAQGETTLVQLLRCVSGMEDLVELRDLRGGPDAKTDPMSVVRGE